MKIKVTSGRWQVTRRVRAENLITHHSPHITAFTMMEIAISLAVIGIALVGIIAILPRGMQTQRENREQTLINQDATVFMENIRNGARGRFETDLTNYVYAITNYQTFYSPTPGTPTVFGYDNSYLTNNERIIGLLSAPEYTDNFGNPIYDISGGNYYSNHIVAYVHSISGSAIEKPPQDNTLLLNSSFGYEILCVNAPLAADTNALNSAYGKNLAANLRELRLTFRWPVLPNGKLGGGHLTYRASVAGTISTNNLPLYFYQPQFTNAP